ncbi:hypothetical protein Tco_1141156, partial [Tanacetum coccineum]
KSPSNTSILSESLVTKSINSLSFKLPSSLPCEGTAWRGESWGVGRWCSGPGVGSGEGEGVGEGECSGEWEGEDVILEGEVTSSIEGKSATSYLE